MAVLRRLCVQQPTAARVFIQHSTAADVNINVRDASALYSSNNGLRYLILFVPPLFVVCLL